MLFAEKFTGHIGFSVLWGWPPKVRFSYVDAQGVRTYFYPDEPKRGWAACWHALWFKGHVRKG